MTAAKEIDVIARLPDCDGQAADAVSANTQAKMEDAPRLLKKSKARVSRYVDTSSTPPVATIMVKHRRSLWFLLNEICTDTRSQDCCGKDILKKFCWNWDGEEVPNWESLCVHRKQGLFSSVYVDDIKMTGRKQKLSPMWKKQKKLVDLGEATSLIP